MSDEEIKTARVAALLDKTKELCDSDAEEMLFCLTFTLILACKATGVPLDNCMQQVKLNWDQVEVDKIDEPQATEKTKLN
jgi:hypothetical protein